MERSPTRPCGSSRSWSERILCVSRGHASEQLVKTKSATQTFPSKSSLPNGRPRSSVSENAGSCPNSGSAGGLLSPKGGGTGRPRANAATTATQATASDVRVCSVSSSPPLSPRAAGETTPRSPCQTPRNRPLCPRKRPRAFHAEGAEERESAEDPVFEKRISSASSLFLRALCVKRL